MDYPALADNDFKPFNSWTLDQPRQDKDRFFNLVQCHSPRSLKGPRACCPLCKNPRWTAFINQNPKTGIFWMRCSACQSNLEYFRLLARLTKRPLGEVQYEALRERHAEYRREKIAKDPRWNLK